MKNMIQLLNLPPSAGSVDVLTVVDGQLSVYGWMFHPSRTFEYIEAYLDGGFVGRVEAIDRPDVAKVFEWAKDASPSGFHFGTHIDEEDAPKRMDFLGYADKSPIARLSCYLPSEEKKLPHPPDHLTMRVSGLHGPVFRAQGLRMFTDLMDQMIRFGIPTTGRILDWGCGCGRVAHYFLTLIPQAKILGCDIDGQAIEWCRQNLGADFIHIEPMPPTPFKSADVDVIIACSVLTHLSEEDQDRWLVEMRRILAPGGYFLASTHGEHAFQVAQPDKPSDARGHHLTGILDSQLDSMLDGIAPPGYYRATFQSREHTIKACSKYFQVVDYVEHGLCGYQDLIILRRA